MIKGAKYTYKGMLQDVSKSKHPAEFYYNGRNIRILNMDSQTAGSVTNEKGNTLVLSIPNVVVDKVNSLIKYNNKELYYTNTEEINSLVTTGTSTIIGSVTTNSSIVLITSNSNGFDCIWEVKDILNSDALEIELLYCRNLQLSINNPLQVIYNYENKKIEKIYWVDGENQYRFVNLRHSVANGDAEELIDLKQNTLNAVSNFNLSQPVVIGSSGGGTHTAGMVQYTYNLYRLNGAQTSIAPMSDLYALDKGNTLGGGEVNEIVGTSPIVKISTLDEQYTHIKVYAIKYTSYRQDPAVSLIIDEEIDTYTDKTFSDTGASILDVSLSQFLFLGSDPIIPKHIQTKFNRLFFANIREKSFDLDIDMRAYSFNSSQSSLIYDNIQVDSNGVPIKSNPTTVSKTTWNIPKTHDSVNLDYTNYKYQADGTTIGGEGKFIKYEIKQKSISVIEDMKFFKDREVYRIGIELFNKLGQTTPAKWVSDFIAPVGNLQGSYNTLYVTLKQTALNNYIASLGLPEDETPIGYRVLRADRGLLDRTILCQGVLTGMMVQTYRDLGNGSYWDNINNRKTESRVKPKFPWLYTREFNDNIYPVYGASHLKQLNRGRPEGSDEIYGDNSDEYRFQQSWQYNKLLQMYSPEITFDEGITFGVGLDLKVIGGFKLNESGVWHKQVNVSSLETVNEGVLNNSTDIVNIDIVKIKGMFGPNKEGKENKNETVLMAFQQFYKKYKGFIPSTSNPYRIYGTPEITERGQGSTSYNGDGLFRYLNTFEAVLTDKYNGNASNSFDEEAITGYNSYGGKCVTLVEGAPTAHEDTRKSLDALKNASGIPDTDIILTSEIKRPANYVYTGSVYGGVTIAAKKRTLYVEIGNYAPLSTASIQIDSPGDTFVQDFKFERISKTDTELYSANKGQITEILSFPVETSVNLYNRNDLSLSDWDAKNQPRYDEFHKYNRVYSQESDLIQNQSISNKFKDVTNFDTRIVASKLKTPGEFIDSWTDILTNEVVHLDGKYGPINSLVSANDEIYALQDSGVAFLSIQPRVQVQGSDGIAVELGTGGILHDYKYLTTDSGTINKWSVFNSPSGFFYFDAINKAWNKFNGKSLVNLADTYGMHAFFQNNTFYNDLKKDNPLLKTGVTGVYDQINSTALLTMLQKNKAGEDKSFTLAFNDKGNVFSTFFDFLPSMYLEKGFKFLSLNPTNDKLYEHFKGDYSTYYGTKYPSYITLQLNPEANLDCVFNNLEFNSELYIDDIDQPGKTLTHISAWNEYQDTGRKPLSVGINSNLRRKFRSWRAQIPRDAGTLDRIRGPWCYLKLELDSEDNSKLILHDVTIYYTV